MAGINRLGKGPPKPGSYRPPDPNKYRTMDMYSEGAEGDADYMRMVQDIEDTQQNQVGWLFGRGAFDKGDLLYLRDEEEKRRFKETELRDSERIRFQALRAGVDSHRDPPAPNPAAAPPPGSSAAGPSTGLLKDPLKPPRPGARLMPVAVKARPLGGASASAPGSSRPPSGKRPASAPPSRPLSATAAPSAQDVAKRPRVDAAHPQAASSDPPKAVLTAAAGSPADKSQQQPVTTGYPEPAADDGAGLSSLLGGYDSDSDEGGTGSAAAAAVKPEPAQHPGRPGKSSAGLPNG
ncbi:hypothetical protein WJX74_008847 [Apatococcus lobatus]|uniref:Uncharacterized protein n=2 Tax=Apatococcus TaxID=904362 RepID=A0AAW1TLD1_9CHLO